MSLFDSLRAALTKTAGAISSIGDVFTKKNIDKVSLEECEDILLSADFGVKATAKILAELQAIKFEKSEGPDAFRAVLERIICGILQKSYQTLNIVDNELNIILFCGVNGNGKTTSIGKLANFYKKQGKKVLLAACDTFRSAAVEQLEIWGTRAGCKVIKGKERGDPAAVAYSAISTALQEDCDILIIDTAGRLQNNHNLMSELGKINNVVKKAYTKHHLIHSVLTIDATTGQNASIQVEKFLESSKISGLIFTKIDGTARGGALVGICDKYNLPVFFLCNGEGIEDICTFNSMELAKSIIS